MNWASQQEYYADIEEAESFQPRPPRSDEAEMDITPMIDITFLLLIFFLVASKMDSGTEVSLPVAQHGTAVTTKSSAFLTLTQGAGDLATVYLGNGTGDDLRLRTEDLVDQETEIAAYVERMLRDENKEQVVIKAEKSVKHREVARVMRAVGLVEDATIFVAVLEEG